MVPKSVCIVWMSLFFLTACQSEDKSFSGYLDADLTYLSADFSGRLKELPVSRGQLVKTNEFLFKLEQTNEQYAVDLNQLNGKSLQAQRQQILDQIHYNEINYRRIICMRKQHAASQNDLDVANKDLLVSKQQLADLNEKIKNNQVDTASKKWVASRKENVAPQVGLIFDTYYTPGEFIQAGYPILSLITKEKIKVVFFVGENKLSALRLNQGIQISTSSIKNFAKGHIAFISNIAEYTPPIIYSREERQKLVFRIEAQIDAPDLEKLHLGQPVTLELAE